MILKLTLIGLFICNVMVIADLHAQRKINVDTLLKFQIEKIEIEEEIDRHLHRATPKSVLEQKQVLINKYKNKLNQGLKSSNQRLKLDSNTFYFTSAVPNDAQNSSQIISTGGYSHQVRRGINLLTKKFGQYTVTNFDLYEDPTLVTSFLTTLEILCAQKLFFAVVVDREFEILSESDRLKLHNLGFKTLAELQKGQAYIGYFHRGFIKEYNSGNSLVMNFSDEIAKIMQHQKLIENNSKEVSRFIAHAGGEIEGYTYTNSLNALDSSYKNGSRYFELDISETSDSVFVATHDWSNWAFQTGFQGTLPPTVAEYNGLKIYGKYIPLDMNAINQWFMTHSDAILVSDKVNEPTRFSSKFADKSRLMMELFTLDAVKEGLTCGIKSAIASESVVYETNSSVDALVNLGVKHIAISRNIIRGNEAWFERAKLNNLDAYIYHVFDEELEVSNYMRYVYGMYADQWTHFK